MLNVMDIFESIRLMSANEQAYVQYRIDEEQTMQEDMEKGWRMWDEMHKLDFIAEDAVIRKESPEMILKFMNEVLQNDWEREYFLRMYSKYIKHEGWKEGYKDGWNDNY